MIKQNWTNPKSPQQSQKRPVESLPEKTEGSQLKDLEKKEKALERSYQERVLFQINRIKGEEQEVYNRQNRLTEAEIKSLQTELQLLVKSTDKLDKSLDIAVQRETVETNTYSLTFLQHLKTAVKQFRIKLEDASVWLSTWSAKSKKRQAFWGVFAGKKGGGKFLLSEEHYLSRSAG